MSRGRLFAALLTALVVGIPLASAGTYEPPPMPTIDPPTPPELSADSNASFTFSDSDPTATFKCRLDSNDDNAFASCTPPQSYSGLQDASHTFDVRAVSASMEEGPWASYTWVIDTSPPPPPSITGIPSPNDSTPTFEFADSEPGVAFRCRLDSRAFANCKSPKTYARQADGGHTFSVRAVDEAGNKSSTTSYTWTIDTAPPVLTITQAPPNPSPGSTARFEFRATDATQVTFGCRLDGAAFSRCTSPTTYSSLALGAHTFAVRATDAAGNPSAAVGYGWTVKDTVGPATVSRVRRNVAYGLLKLAWNRPPDPDFDHVRVFVSKGKKGAKARRQTLVYSGKATHYTKKRYDNGTYHRFTIVGYDVAGNASPGVPVVVPPSILLRRPQLGVVVHVPPRLVWAGARGASFYNVQLYRAGRKILSAWPNAPRLGLKRRWSYSGHSVRLKKGTYAWFVWPAFGPRATSRYGHLLGWSQFTVR
jgi:hypothetical protein